MLDSLADAEQAIEESFGNTIKLNIGENLKNERKLHEIFISKSLNSCKIPYETSLLE